MALHSDIAGYVNEMIHTLRLNDVASVANGDVLDYALKIMNFYNKDEISPDAGVRKQLLYQMDLCIRQISEMIRYRDVSKTTTLFRVDNLQMLTFGDFIRVAIEVYGTDIPEYQVREYKQWQELTKSWDNFFDFYKDNVGNKIPIKAIDSFATQLKRQFRTNIGNDYYDLVMCFVYIRCTQEFTFDFLHDKGVQGY